MYADNQKYVDDYLLHLKAKGDCKRSLYKCNLFMRHWLSVLEDDMLQMTQTEIQLAIVAIMQKPLSISTKEGIKGYIKSIYKFHGRDTPFIKRKRIISQLDPLKLLSEEEVRRMLAHSASIRDNAIIMLLWDTGIRTGELMNMQLDSIELLGSPPHIFVNGKTGRRSIPIHMETAKLMVQYIDTLSERQGPLWRASDKSNWKRNISITNDGINKMLRETAARAMIPKRITVYTFRHSVATRDAKYYTEALMRAKFGWTKDSEMAAGYVHLSARDLDEAMEIADEKLRERSILLAVS